MPGSGATRSVWMDGVSLIPADGPLQGDTQADVCIVGAGLAGLTTAYLLAKEGRSVIVIDDGPPGMGESLRTTAHLTAAIDDRIHVLERKFGAKKARIAVESQVAAIDRVERICADEHLDGIFQRVDGYLFLHPTHKEDDLQKEFDAARKAGLDVRFEGSAPLPFPTGPALVFPRQAEVDAGEYLSGLADAIRRMGGRIHASTHATELEDGEPAIVTTAKGRIEADHVVVCTDSPVFGKVPMHTKQEQYRTYVVAYEVPRGTIPRGLYWDTLETGYHYIRLADRAEPGMELLIVGGEDHRTGEGDPEAAIQRLEDWVKAQFDLAAPVHRWSGQVVEPVDHLPFQGRYPGKGKNVYVITGDSGQGFTNHTCGAMLVTDLIQARRNPWQSLYRPNRQALSSLLERLRSNTEGAAESAKDKVGSKSKKTAEPKQETKEKGPAALTERDIAPGSGAILQRDGKPVACYREPSGELRECAAQCTHMGATVRWNDLEKTWDCPWHGSRFSAAGHVINGPANDALEPEREPRGSTMPTRTTTKASRAHGRKTTTAGRKGRATRTRSGTRTSKAKASTGNLRGRGHPDAIALLKEDHRKVKQLLSDLDEAEEGAERQSLFEEIEQELLVHARLEEELFYPAFKDAVGDDDEDKKMYFEAHEEHEIAERVAAEIRAHDDPDSDEYAAKCKVLKDLIEHHIQEEEHDMFPVARKEIGREQLLLLAEDMRQRKQEMQAGEVSALRRIQAPRDAIVPGSEPQGAREGDDGSMWQRMRRRPDQ